MSDPALSGKVIVIIGGTTGLGLSAAHACVNAGAQVVIVGRNADSAKNAQTALGVVCRALVDDATESDTATRAIREARAHFDGFHGLYHVAGGSGRASGDGPLHEVTDAGWEYTIRQNVTSVFYSNRAAIQQFLEDGTGGSILNMSSVLGFAPSPGFFGTHSYAAAKAAVIGLTKSAAAYYAPHNIRINVLAPALVDTPMATRAVNNDALTAFTRSRQPLDGGRVGAPGDTDAAVVYFLSDQSAFVTGQVLAVDGGWSVSDGGPRT